MINRLLAASIKADLFGGKLIIITGARQVGKTTLAREIVASAGIPCKWFNGDEPDVRSLFENITSARLRKTFGNYRLIVIDEAQRIRDIGIILKLASDNIPDVQLLVTGSSSLELSSGIIEPLTGRAWEFNLYPLSFLELSSHHSAEEEIRLLEHRLVYGYYPEVLNKPGQEERSLHALVNNYLYKDFLSLEQVRKPALVEKLLLALALQLGSEVSFREIGQLIGADNETVEKYVNLLEKVFVIFTLGSFSRNLRNEIKRNRKIYFWDNGVRNTIINNFNSVPLRNDIGPLWENFLVAERLKKMNYLGTYINKFFWRTTQKQEIDYIEERKGSINAYEFKWSPKKKKSIPSTFLNAYPGSKSMIISRDNFHEFIGSAE